MIQHEFRYWECSKGVMAWDGGFTTIAIILTTKTHTGR